MDTKNGMNNMEAINSLPMNLKKKHLNFDTIQSHILYFYSLILLFPKCFTIKLSMNNHSFVKNVWIPSIDDS